MLKIDTSDLWKKGLDFISNFSLNTTNMFLERGTSKLDKSHKFNKKRNAIHVWTYMEQSKYKNGNSSFYLKNYFNACFIFITDLFDNNGNFLV